MEKVPCDQERQVQQGNFKKALETIASIMNGSIEVENHLNLDTESTAIGINSETSNNLNSESSTEVDSNTVANSDSDAINVNLGLKPGFKTQKSTQFDNRMCL